MEVPEWRGVFVLGSHARYVTVYGQQVRALNLVSALVRDGRVSSSTRIAVVGAGIAGLTAAAGLARAGAGLVTVFESDASLIPLQSTTEKRYIHPHIYDWPAAESRNKWADLPIMRWEAGIAADVTKNLLSQFEDVRKEVGQRLPEPQCGVKDIEIGEGPSLIVGGDRHSLDLVILAVGFGRDNAEDTSLAYWSDDDLGATEHEKQRRRWLVSGAGDGALTDLMRLCIRGFRHQDVLEAVDAGAREEVGQDLLKLEQSSADPATRADAFRKAAEIVDQTLTRRLPHRDVGAVYLNCERETLFGPGSSVLNRLITALLERRHWFEIVPGRIASYTKNDGRYHVVFQEGTEMDVDRLVLRHGPKSPYRNQAWLASIERATRDVRDAWRNVRQFDDWTRTPLYDEEVPFENLSQALRIDFGDRVGCVIVTGANELTGRSIEERVGDSLVRIAASKATERYAPGKAVDTVPLRLEVEEVLSSAAMYERAVRALCASDIAVFDVTGYESAVMLMLGIRAAIRRGVTVTVSKDRVDDAPFNIASLNPVVFKEKFVETFANALEQGFTTLSALPDFYLDLPAYDAVRWLGDDAVVREPSAEVLVLRWFDDQYSEFVGNEIIPNLLTGRWPSTGVVTTLDSRSPQLVEQRLYAAIRRDLLCIADWTSARPNVFFELGVRLAVSPHDPLSILCEKKPKGWKNKRSKWPARDDRWLEMLETLFGVTRFSVNDTKPLRDRIASHQEPSPGALVSGGRTYKVLAKTIDKRREPGGEAVHEWLLRQAKKLTGAPVEAGGVPLLYGEELGAEVRKAAAERALAAWYYLDGRYKIVERLAKRNIAPDDPLLAALRKAGSDVSAHSRDTTSDIKKLAADIRMVLLDLDQYVEGDG